MRAAIGVPHTMMHAVRPVFRVGDRMDAEQTFKAADDATERASDDCTNRTCCVHADGTAVGNSFRHALRVGSKRQCERGGGNGSTKDVQLHSGTFPLVGML